MNPQLSRAEFELFQALLVEEIGIHFDHDRQGLLRMRLAERMAARRINSVPEYFSLIKSPADGRDELRTLIDLVTVGETYFFRNQPHFDALTQHLLPALIHERQAGDRRITIWSAACSTGEEPYSIAMCLLETLPNPESWTISLLATDVNREHLKRAHEAVYVPRAVRKVPELWRQRYFIERGGNYALKDAVKCLVHFQHHNLVKDPYAHPGMHGVDFLFCRNVIIYFPIEVIRRVIDHMTHSLAPAGSLFIGDAETLWQLTDKLSPVEFPQAFVYRHAARRAATPTQTRTVPERAPTRKPSLPSFESAVHLGRQAWQAKDHGKALAHYDDVLRADPHHVHARLGKARVLADQDQHEEAIVHLLQAIRFDSLCAEAYYLLGVLHARANRIEEAIDNLQHAVYVDPAFALAYFSLAGILRAQGQPAGAGRQFENALRAIIGKPDDELVRFSDDITCGYLRRACQRSLELLAGQPKTSAGIR